MKISISFILLTALLLSSGCKTISESINQLQSGLGLHSNVKKAYGVTFEATSCDISPLRIVTCRLRVTSHHQDRTLKVIGGNYTVLQDDTGQSYPTRMSFGQDAEGGQKHSVLVADTPYNLTLVVENISSQAKKIRAINIKRMDLRKADGSGIQYVKLVLNDPPLPTKVEQPKQATTATPTTVAATTSSQPATNSGYQHIREYRGVRFETKSCELNQYRVITCRLIVTSKHRDRILDLIGGHYTRVQDDTGKSYPTIMSFGRNAEDKQRKSVLVADTPYDVTLRAENISSQATKVRAIDITRMDMTYASGGGLQYAKLVLAHPPMVAAQENTPPATQKPAPQPRVSSPKPATTAQPRSRQTTNASTKPRQQSSTKKNLVGCWQWSNGAYIVVNADGTAQNGPIKANWKTISVTKQQYQINWPSLVDTLTLSQNGSALSGKNNLGFDVTATRKSGQTTTLIGDWLWGNGVTVSVKSNGQVTGGAYHGTWRKADKQWIIEWPITDKIVIANNGKSLNLSNQFGALTAKRDTHCKGR